MKPQHQDLPERIAKLAAHRKSRRGRRDFQALTREAQLAKLLRDGPKSNWTLTQHADLLKRIYTSEDCPPNRLYMMSSPFFAMIKKEKPVAHFEDDEPPIKTHPASKEYRENYDRIFGEKKAPDRCATCGWTLAEKPEDGCVVANCSMRNK